MHQRSHFDDTSHPSPGDLAVFLPWALDQLLVNIDLLVTKNIVEDLTTKSKGNKPRTNDVGIECDAIPAPGSGSKEFTFNTFPNHPKPRLVLRITCDQYDHVTGLLFQNMIIPRKLMQILGLIINFHDHLTSMTIKKGLDATVLYELKKVLLLSKVTTVYIDNCFVAEGNYYILLDISCLTNMALTRCKIDDVVVGMIAERLKFPTPGSSGLVALSLSTNHIGDAGAKSIGDALRANVKLAYLNLADNMISDTGAQDILHSLEEFALTYEELVAARRRSMEYRTKRHELVMEILKESRAKDIERRSANKKPTKIILTPSPSSKKEKKGLPGELSKSITDTADATPISAASYDKAEATANQILGPFIDPHAIGNTVIKEGEFFCPGNNTLCYLNLAYNNLTYFSAVRMLEVLTYQRETNRKPKGLVNVSLEGNPMPLRCKELAEIDWILDKGLSAIARRPEKRAHRRSH